MEILGLITARGGSKGIPRKNLQNIVGKPLIAWTIQAAQQAQAISRIILSTDDEEIAQVGRDYKIDVPFMRPSELAEDSSSHVDVIIHALRWLADNENYHPDYVLVLQPTSPLRSADDIENAVELAIKTGADSVTSVCEAPSHPYIVKKLTVENKLVDFIPVDKSYLRRQDYPDAYALNGAIYLARCNFLLRNKRVVTDNTLAYIMPIERSLDIDTWWDLHLANLILSDLKKNGNYKGEVL